MKKSKRCEVCKKDFYPRKDKYDKARTCSVNCRCKLAGNISKEKYIAKWDALTEYEKKNEMMKAFFKHVEKTDTCWIWINANKGKDKLPYGSLCFRGKRYNAHKLSWIIHNGKVIENNIVCHKCDNASCVNPDHLFLGTYTDNQRDKLKKGRCVVEKLSIKQVKEIKNKLKEGVTSKRLASDYGVSTTTLHCIKFRKTWRDID